MMHTTFRMPARRLLSTALVSCLMLAAAPNVMAQSANASLRGQVAGAQAGTEVTATNVATGTVRRGTIRADGRKIHPAYLVEVKKPSESKGPYDYYKVLATIPADQAFRPMAEGGCELVKK